MRLGIMPVEVFYQYYHLYVGGCVHVGKFMNQQCDFNQTVGDMLSIRPYQDDDDGGTYQ